jgi:protein ImuB
MRTQDLVEALADLPVAYLTDHAPTQKLFAGISCLTFGDCEALPRAGLSHRGAQSFLRLRDQALGETADPRVSWQAPDQFDQRIELPWPATRSDTLIFACKRLFSALMATLKARQKVIEHFTLEFEHPKNPPTTMKIHLGSACRDEARWILLTREHLSLRALPEPAEAITLKADEWQDEQDSSDSLFPDFRKGQEARSVLIARLRARLGENAVSQLSLRADHRPEHCFTRLSGGQPEKMSAHEGARPVWLFETPSPLCSSPHTPWKDPQLICLAGPERIESGWWEGQEVARDYYIAQHRDGRIWWLFQDLNAPYAWFIHGLFS